MFFKVQAAAEEVVIASPWPPREDERSELSQPPDGRPGDEQLVVHEVNALKSLSLKGANDILGSRVARCAL